MEKQLLSFAIEDLRRQLKDVDPFSQSLIFNPEYASFRSHRPIHGPSTSWRTLLSLLLHEGMDSARRAQIFPGKFDLGNQHEIPIKECTYEQLLDDLSPPPDTDKPLKPVKDGIKALTGLAPNKFFAIDKANTFKVIKAMYSFCQKREKFTIFSTLAAPEFKKSGMEFRSVHSNEKTKELASTIADLREYLGAELETERIVEIRNAFDALQSNFERIDSKLLITLRAEKASTSRAQPQAVEKLFGAIRDFKFDLTSTSISRLDETLYVYMTSLEYRHFFQQQIKLIRSASLRQTKIVSIADQLSDFSQWAHTVPARLASSFFALHANEVQALVEEALQTPTTEAVLNKYGPYVDSLLSRVLIFNQISPPIFGESEASPSLVVAAFCAIHTEHLKRTNHKPYWHGQPAIGDSLLESLRIPFSDETVYEEHTQIWRERLNTIHETINGNGERYNQMLQLTGQLLDRVSELVQLSDIKSIANNAMKFFEHIAAQCQQIEAPSPT